MITPDWLYNLFTSILNSKPQVNSLDRPLFIWGAPRSGTTLFYQLMAQHPDTGYLINAKTNKPREGTGFWWHVFGEQRGIMDASLAQSQKINQVRNDYARMLKAQKKSRLLDKIPFMILWIPLINEVFPQARHFHIIRDGRAVVNSVLYKVRYAEGERYRLFREKKLLFGPYPPELLEPMSLPSAQRYARQWLLLVEQGRRNAGLLGERYFELRYEDLVNDPRGWLKAAFEHAQLDYDDRFITETIPENLTSQNYKWQSDNQTKFEGDTRQRALDPDDIFYLAEMNPLLQVLGYSLSENKSGKIVAEK
jgi:hypothetical protein